MSLLDWWQGNTYAYILKSTLDSLRSHKRIFHHNYKSYENPIFTPPLDRQPHLCLNFQLSVISEPCTVQYRHHCVWPNLKRTLQTEHPIILKPSRFERDVLKGPCLTRISLNTEINHFRCTVHFMYSTIFNSKLMCWIREPEDQKTCCAVQIFRTWLCMWRACIFVILDCVLSFNVGDLLVHICCYMEHFMLYWSMGKHHGLTNVLYSICFWG